MDANLHAWRSKMQTNVKPVSYSNDDNLKKLSFLMDDLNTFFNTRLRRTNTFCVSYLFLCEPLIEHWGHTVTVEGGGEGGGHLEDGGNMAAAHWGNFPLHKKIR